MKNSLCILVMALWGLSTWIAYGQWSAVSSGGTDTLGRYVLNTSIGELLVDDVSAGRYHYKFGVQQPYRGWEGARVRGTLRYPSLNPVALSGVQVSLKKNGQTVASTTTLSQGQFDLGLVDSGLYTLEYATTQPWRGVNSSDALMVMRHFSGIQLLSGIRLLAGDVGRRGFVNGQDALNIARRVVREIQAFVAGDWVHDIRNLSIANGDTAFQLPVNSLCYGDVNASFFPGPTVRLASEPLIAKGLLNSSPIRPYDWPISLTTAQSVGAITLDLKLPEGLQLQGVEIDGQQGTDVTESASMDRVAGTNFLYRREGKALRIVWFRLNPMVREADQPLLTLKVRGIPTGMLEMIPGGELADELAQPLDQVRLSAPIPGGLNWQANLVPNPTSESSHLALTLPTAGVVEYTVVDALGREVAQGREETTMAGFYRVELMSSLWSTGTYSVRVRWQGMESAEVRTLRLMKLNR